MPETAFSAKILLAERVPLPRKGANGVHLFSNRMAPPFDLRASALALLVLGVLADDHHDAVALDDLAFFTHGFHRRSDFHVIKPPVLTCFSR